MLITAAEVADTLGGLSPTDTLLVSVVNDTDAWAKRALGRNFERKTYTETVRGYGHPYVFLRESPIRALTEVRIDPFGVFADDTVIDDLASFTFDADPNHDNSKLSWAGLFGVDLPAYVMSGYVSAAWLPFSESARAAQVTYEAGWWPADDQVNTPDLPSDLRGRLVRRARVEFKRAVGQSDDETKGCTDDTILRELQHYMR